MEKVINSYECLFIVDVTKGDETCDATVNKFLSMIEANAEVVDVAKWGKRRLAYPINDMPEGYYVVATFKTEPAFPAELDRIYNIDESIMRSMTIKLDYEAVKHEQPVIAEEVSFKEEDEAAPVAEAAPEAPVAEETATDAE